MIPSSFLSPEDYVEPVCPLCKPQAVMRVPLQRISEKLDEYMGRQDFDGARRHLDYWLTEARSHGDGRGEFGLHNEMMGFFRKMGQGEDAIAHAQSALSLLDEVGADSVAAATAFVNAATVYQAFSRPQTALPLFERAQAIYEKQLSDGDGRLGGLYNNMALTLTALSRFDEARSYYAKALRAMSQVENGALEQAITYLNMADCEAAQYGPEAAENQVTAYLDKAIALLDDPALPRSGYYAFVCEKCAPAFDYHGYFLTAKELEKRARDIYERA